MLGGDADLVDAVAVGDGEDGQGQAGFEGVEEEGDQVGFAGFEAVPVVAVVENEAGEVAEGVEDEFADLAGAFVVMRVVVGWGEIAAEVGEDGGGVAA